MERRYDTDLKNKGFLKGQCQGIFDPRFFFTKPQPLVPLILGLEPF
jgi:hypothetical protein